MDSFIEFFLARMSAAFRANLTGIFVVNLSKILASFPTYPRQQIAELSKTPVKHLLTQKPFGRYTKVNVFHKDHVCLVAESMASLKVKILTSIVDSMMKSSYFKLCFFPVFRPLLLPRCSTLQHFKPTLPVSEKSCWFDSEIIASYQKRFQSNINPDSSPKRYRLRNISITHDRDNCIPNSSSCSRYNPDSFCPKPFWD